MPRHTTKKGCAPTGRILFYLYLYRRLLAAAGLQLLEEVVSLVVHEDEGGEVFHFNLPDGFHAQFGIFHALDALDIVLGQDGCRATDGAEVETAVLLAGVGHGLAAVTLGQHDHAASMALEQVDVRVHTAGCRGPQAIPFGVLAGPA